MNEPIRSAGVQAECETCTELFTVTTAAKKYCQQCAIEHAKASVRRRTARRKAAPITDRYTIADIRARDGDKCHICNLPVDFSLSAMHRMGPTVDHLVPLSLGGWDGLSNAALAHRLCNIVKGNRWTDSPRLNEIS